GPRLLGPCSRNGSHALWRVRGILRASLPVRPPVCPAGDTEPRRAAASCIDKGWTTASNRIAADCDGRAASAVRVRAVLQQAKTASRRDERRRYAHAQRNHARVVDGKSEAGGESRRGRIKS